MSGHGIEVYPEPKEELVSPGQVRWWLQRLPIVLVAVAVMIVAYGLILDRVELEYLAISSEVPGNKTGAEPLYYPSGDIRTYSRFQNRLVAVE